MDLTNIFGSVSTGNSIFDSFLDWFFTAVSNVFGVIINIVTAPIMAILNSLIPNFNSYFGYLNDFFNNYIFKGIRFIKMAFINTLHINTNIFSIVVLIFTLSISIFFATRGLKLFFNLWSLKNNAKTKN